ncbi:MAG: hypothetical protein IT582_00595, partial [Opitutaceae bacterium]|nr:hypothetical protein [Opitutaceae bacterium]
MTRPLRIFLACQQDLGGPPHPVPAYRFWRGYFTAALREAGHELLEAPGCDWAAGLPSQSPEAQNNWRDQTWSHAWDWLRVEHVRRPVDLFLGYLYPQQVHPGALAEIRRGGIPCVNFFCDNVREFRRVPATYHGFDLHWVPEAAAVPLYRRAGLPVLHAPMPCWVPPALREPPIREFPPVTFIGSHDELRAELFAGVIAAGLDLML